MAVLLLRVEEPPFVAAARLLVATPPPLLCLPTSLLPPPPTPLPLLAFAAPLVEALPLLGGGGLGLDRLGAGGQFPSPSPSPSLSASSFSPSPVRTELSSNSAEDDVPFPVGFTVVGAVVASVSCLLVATELLSGCERFVPAFLFCYKEREEKKVMFT